MDKILLLFIFSAIFCIANCSFYNEVLEEWTKHKSRFGLRFNSDGEEYRRLQIFAEAKERIDKHNLRYKQGSETYEKGINKFSHLTFEEMSQQMLCRKDGPLVRNAPIANLDYGSDVPDKVDWREKGAITSIKDQKSCGGCWAFSAVGVTEAHHFLKTENLVSLSDQQVIDCDKHSYGCSGVWENRGLEYIKEAGGIQTEKTYPFESRDGECRADPSKFVNIKVKKVVQTPPDDENGMKVAMATVGPITVALHATVDLFDYRNGIYSENDCDYAANHALVGVGYGIENGTEYWLIKNSWGLDWGEKGYLKLVRNKNMCHVAHESYYPEII